MTVLRLTSLALVKLGYVLETLSIPHYSFIGSQDSVFSENVLGAGNQQERPVSIRSLESPETTRQGFDTHSNQDIVRAAWRHAGVKVYCECAFVSVPNYYR